MNRHDVTELIVTQRIAKGISWAAIAKAVGQSKEWVTAGCLGQMTFTAAQAAVIGEIKHAQGLEICGHVSSGCLACAK